MTNSTKLPCQTCARQLVSFASQDLTGWPCSVLYCNNCGIGITLPQPDDLLLHELYSTQYYRNGEGTRFVRPIEWLIQWMRRWRVHRLTRHVTTGRALDIGCGSGRFLRMLQETGWEVAGLELNHDTATSARKLHGLIVNTALDSFSEESFELITITHVLEHIRNPRQMLYQCSRLLKQGGVIAVAVPNIQSWQAQFMRSHWFHLDLPRHLWHFSEKWLSKALADLGFEQVTVRRLDLAHNIFGWMQSMLNLLRLDHNCLYDFLSCNENKVYKSKYTSSIIISWALVPFLLPLSITLACFEAIFSAGGTVEIIARRKNRL